MRLRTWGPGEPWASPALRRAAALPKPLAEKLGETLLIRRAALPDVPALLTIVNAAFTREDWLIPGPRITEGELLDEVLSDRVTLLVAQAAGRLAGCVHLRERPDEAGGDSLPELGLLAVAPEAQGRGIGPALVREVERRAAERGWEGLFLRCARELGMVGYYEALGYEAVAVAWGRHLGARQPFHLVTMCKALGEPGEAG